jgi:hypothetical protein
VFVHALAAVRSTTLAALLMAGILAQGTVLAQGASGDTRSATRKAPEAGSTPGRSPRAESAPGRTRDDRSTQGASNDARSSEGRPGPDSRSADRARENDRRSRTPSN